MRRALLVIIAIVALLMVAIWGFQRQLIYLPDRSAVRLPSGAEDVRMHTSDGETLGGWLFASRGRDRGLTVLVASGNAGNRSARVPLARALVAAGFAVLLFDYRGYGDSTGSPSEDGLANDARAARRFLIEEAGVPSDRLIYFGESLGAAVVADLAVAHPPAGLLLRSPFTDLAAVGQIHYPFLPVRALLRDRFPVVAKVAKVQAPTAVVYGTADSIVPPEQSRAVAKAAGGPTYVVPVEGADHNDLDLLNGEELINAVILLAEGAPGSID